MTGKNRSGMHTCPVACLCREGAGRRPSAEDGGVEMPTLDRLQTALGSADFKAVALSVDRGGPPTVEEFYQEVGLRSLGVYVGQNGEASRTLGTIGMPTTLLIGREGREVMRKIGPAEWAG